MRLAQIVADWPVSDMTQRNMLTTTTAIPSPSGSTVQSEILFATTAGGVATFRIGTAAASP